MGQRNRQHMGRSSGDDRDLVGRDVRDGDATSDAAERGALPTPNEEGTDFRPDGRAESGSDRRGGRDPGDRDRSRQDDARRSGDDADRR